MEKVGIERICHPARDRYSFSKWKSEMFPHPTRESSVPERMG